MPETAGDRRPISARSWAVSQSITHALVKLRISANAISVIGAMAALIGGSLFAETKSLEASHFKELFPWAGSMAWLCGAVLIEVRLLANMFDGMVAIESGTASRYGELYNDVPDRISDTAFLVGAGYAAGGEPWLGWAAALAAMATAYIRALGRGLTGTQDFCGPMAKPHRMQLLALAAVLAAAAAWIDWPQRDLIPQIALWIILVGSIITSIRRLLRIAQRLKEGTR